MACALATWEYGSTEMSKLFLDMRILSDPMAPSAPYSPWTLSIIQDSLFGPQHPL